MSSKKRVRNRRYKGRNLSRVKKGSKVTNRQTIRMLKIKVGNKSVERPCVVYKHRGKRIVHVLEDWRLTQLISLAKAKQHFEKLPKKRQKADLKRTAKNQLEIIEKDGKKYVKKTYLTETGTSRYDIKGIDTKLDEWAKDWEKTELIQKQREKITEIRNIKTVPQFRNSINETLWDLKQIENPEIRLKLAKLYEKEYSPIKEKLDDYIVRSSFSQLTLLQENAEKEVNAKKRYPIDRKKILSMRKKLTKEKDWQVGYEGFGDNVLAHKSKIAMITTPEHFKEIPLGSAYNIGYNTEKVKLEDSYLYGDLISFKKEGAQYHKPFLDEALKEFNNPKIYYREGFPLLVKEDDYVMIIAPRIRDYEDESNEFEVPYKEYQTISKVNTKQEIIAKIKDIDPNYSYKKSYTKDQLLWDYLILLRGNQKRF